MYAFLDFLVLGRVKLTYLDLEPLCVRSQAVFIAMLSSHGQVYDELVCERGRDVGRHFVMQSASWCFVKDMERWHAVLRLTLAF